MARKDVPIFGGPSLWELILAFADPCPLPDMVGVNSGGLRQVSFKVGVGRRRQMLRASIFEMSDTVQKGSMRSTTPISLRLRGDILERDAWIIFDIDVDKGLHEEVEFLAEYNVRTRSGVINIVPKKK